MKIIPNLKQSRVNVLQHGHACLEVKHAWKNVNQDVALRFFSVQRQKLTIIFQVSDKDNGYRLTFDASSYKGDAVNHLKNHNKMRFSAPDRDLDTSSGHCASSWKAGWWYYSCWMCLPTRIPPSWGNDRDFIQLKIRPMSA